MSYPRFQLARNFKFARATANIVCNTASASTWDELAAESGGPGTGVWDFVLAAQVGDVVLCEILARWASEAVASDLDFVTRVSSANVNWISGGNGTTDDGPACWQGHSGVITPVAGAVPYTVQSGDLASGFITLRPVVRTDTASNKTLAMSAASGRGFIRVQNLGPADPN